jgi:hypothetical protein
MKPPSCGFFVVRPQRLKIYFASLNSHQLFIPIGNDVNSTSHTTWIITQRPSIPLAFEAADLRIPTCLIVPVDREEPLSMRFSEEFGALLR